LRLSTAGSAIFPKLPLKGLPSQWFTKTNLNMTPLF
jgi:hypothetical protein